jgi:hypothetical protein
MTGRGEYHRSFKQDHHCCKYVLSCKDPPPLSFTHITLSSIETMELIYNSFIPESPRFLISQDRQEEAYHILVHYHAEGSLHSPFIRAEMAQIASTIRIELANSKRSWLEMVSTPGMRKRVIVGSFLGLFTQWSGNTLISYFLNDLLKLIGYEDPNFKGKLNVGLNSWNLFNAVLISLLVRRFPRRKMYLICATSLMCCYVGWTVSMQQFLARRSEIAAKVTIFWIFAYSPCYNIGYNALTYSKFTFNSHKHMSLNIWLTVSVAFLVELFPFAQRAKGITIFQFFSRSAGFFTTFVNPIGLGSVKWRWLVTYCVWLAFEIVFIVSTLALFLPINNPIPYHPPSIHDKKKEIR